MPSDKEYRPFRFDEPKGQEPQAFSYEEMVRREQERRDRLGPEVEAADGRTRAERDAQYDAKAPPLSRGGDYEAQAWRRSQREEAQLDAQGLPDSSSEDPPTATPGNRLPMR